MVKVGKCALIGLMHKKWTLRVELTKKKLATVRVGIFFENRVKTTYSRPKLDWVGGNRSKERDRKSELVLGPTYQLLNGIETTRIEILNFGKQIEFPQIEFSRKVYNVSRICPHFL